jgi:hypothetical protein
MTPLGFIKLEIPTPVPEPPTGEGWIHEIKYDGYRTLIVADGRQVRAFTRNGERNDWRSKGKFGEVWVGQKGGHEQTFDPEGRSSTGPEVGQQLFSISYPGRSGGGAAAEENPLADQLQIATLAQRPSRKPAFLAVYVSASTGGASRPTIASCCGE